MNDTNGGESALDHLLALAIAEPERAESQARVAIASETSHRTLSVAHQSVGIVLRDRGEADGALSELRTALDLAHRAADADREADVRATLGVTLALAGRTAAGLDQF